MNGVPATCANRALPDWRHCPNAALTASAFDEGRRACSAAGMDDFRSKSMDVAALYGCLLYWLDEAVTGRSRARLSPPALWVGSVYS